jgi:hypothetical protein
VQNGWYRLSSTCDPNSGYAYAQDPSGPTSLSPVVLYYTAGGQLAGNNPCVCLSNSRA